MGIYKEVVSSALDRIDSEWAHDAARDTLHFAAKYTPGILEGFNYGGERFSDPRLQVTLGENLIKYNVYPEGVNVQTTTLENPGMVGAGWDKVGKTVNAWGILGAAGEEVGTVLKNKQKGNLKPRQSTVKNPETGRLVAFNWLGFNTPGMFEVYKILSEFFDEDDNQIPIQLRSGEKIKPVIGISVGKNKDVLDEEAPEAHAEVTELLLPRAGFIVLNVSSPNTPGLRGLQAKEPLRRNVQAIIQVMLHYDMVVPLYIKADPDLTTPELDDIAEIAIDEKAAGIIMGNTTINKDIKGKYGERWLTQGGLSGDDDDFRDLSTQHILHLRKEHGDRLELLGSGGNVGPRSVLEKTYAGAKGYFIVTGIRSEGPGIFGKTNRGIIEEMELRRFRDFNEMVGSAA